MDPNQREQEIFKAALELGTPEKRSALVRAACGEDKELQQKVEALLAAYFASQSYVPTGYAPASPPREESSPREGPGTVLGHYKLLQKIGEGGCGVVYMAEQAEPVRRRVALKIIKLGMDTRNVIARFEAERQALALMEHANIARVLDAGATESGRPYFVMELVRGIKITEYCDQNNLTPRERLELFIQVCHAIQHAHQKGIIHRDIKPSNILVSLHDGVPVPMVIDFGIAKATEQPLTDKTMFTAFEQFIGTPAYMSPEQAELSRLDIDTRSDIYSLGVLLYELLTGKTPFDSTELLAAGVEGMRRTIREQEPMRPSTRLGRLAGEELTTTAARRRTEAPKLIHLVRGDLDWIVMKCLEKDRTRRYETANGLALDIERHLNNEPVVACPPTTAYRVQKFMRRNKVMVGAAGLVALALVLGILGSTWQAVRATHARQAAVVAQRDAAKERGLAEQRLYDSLLGEARAKRLARRVGYREEVFNLLRQARTLDVPGKNLADLRREAVGCFGDFVGLTPITLAAFPTNCWSQRCHPGGRLAAFLLADGSVELRELPSGKEVARMRGEAGDGILCFSVTGDQLVSLHFPDAPSVRERLARSVVHVWSPDINGRWGEVDTLALPNVAQCLASAKGLRLVVADFTVHSLQLIDLKTKEVLHRFKFSKERTDRPVVALSPDDRFLVAESADSKDPKTSEMDVWDLRTGQRVQRLSPNLSFCAGPSFSPDGQLIALPCARGLAVYANHSFERIAVFKEFFGGPRSISFAPDRSLMALSLFQQNRVRLWDHARNENVAMLDEQQGASGLCFTSDGDFLLTIDGNLLRSYLYRLRLSEEKLNLTGHATAVPGIAYSPDGKRLASVGKGLKVWDAVTGHLEWEVELLPGKGQGQAVSYSPDGRLLATSAFDTLLVGLWDAQTGKLLQELGTNAPGPTWSAQFSPDGRYLATAACDASFPDVGDQVPDPGVSVWALEPRELGQPEASLQVKHIKTLPGHCSGLVFGPRGYRMAFGGWSRSDTFDATSKLYIWDDFTAAGEPRMFARDIKGMVYVLSFSLDGGHLMLLSTNRSIVTLDVVTGSQVASFPTIDREISQWNENVELFLSPDGGKLAVSSLSTLGVDIWDPKTGQLLYSLPDQSGTVYCMAWSPDNRRLAISRANGDIDIWNLSEIEHVLAQLGLEP